MLRAAASGGPLFRRRISILSSSFSTTTTTTPVTTTGAMSGSVRGGGGGGGGGLFRSTPIRHIKVQAFLGTKGNPLTPYLAKSYIVLGFAFGMVYVCIFAFNKMIKKAPLEDSLDTKRSSQKKQDPRRPPWPLLHQRVVFMREGQAPHEDIALLWEQCKYYYPHDWLIPLEMGQILKYTTGDYLQAYVSDPDGLRKEVLMQLLNVKYGRVPTSGSHKISKEVEEIISIAVEDLEGMDLRVGRGAPLVPSQIREME